MNKNIFLEGEMPPPTKASEFHKLRILLQGFMGFSGT